MKKFSIVLSMILLVVGLGSCKGDKNQPCTEPTKLTLTSTAVTLKVGETKQLKATVEPTDQTFTVTFSSDKEAVATVDAMGLIKAVAEGTANITAQVGKLTHKCVVTVTDPNGKPKVNELPLLKFIKTKKGKVEDAEILEYEKNLGRVKQSINVPEVKSFDGFVNTDLTTITGVVYGLELKKERLDVILAFSKETVEDCPKTMAMLAEYGFTNLEEKVSGSGATFLEGTNSKDPEMKVQLSNREVPDTKSTMYLFITKKKPKKEIPTEHDIIPTVRDFPDYATLVTGDAAKFHKFENELGFREYNEEMSFEEDLILSFDTKLDKIAESNFKFAVYIYTPTEENESMFINCQLNCIKSEEALADPKLKEWLALNGYTKDYVVDVKAGFVKAYDATGKMLCKIKILRGEFVDFALLQIMASDAKQADVQRLTRQALERLNVQPEETSDVVAMKLLLQSR